jgi:hypothetical protein
MLSSFGDSDREARRLQNARMTALVFADPLQNACRYCATIARAKSEEFFRRGFVPEAHEPTATLTFIAIAGKTYAVTAAHVIDIFKGLAEKDGSHPESYLVPVGTGALIEPPFIRPAKPLIGHQPDVAIVRINAGLPARVGKESFELKPDAVPTFPVPHAMAVGFPTAEKRANTIGSGEQLAMACVQATAEGLGSPDSDQIQFLSTIDATPSITSLSGMSGGPIFWSDGTAYGLLGFIKEALDVVPPPGEESLHPGPRVNFICERASYETFVRWAVHTEAEYPRQRAQLNALVRRTDPT